MEDDEVQLELGELVPCPQYTEDPGVRCGLPSEVHQAVYTNSTDGELEIIAIRCVVGHTYCGPRMYLSY